MPVVGDVTEEATNAAAVAAAQERFGGLDAAFLNAGLSVSGPLETLDLARFDECLDVNLRAVVLGLRAVVPALRQRGGGAVVVNASVTALGGEPGRWPYAAAKAAALNLVRSAAIDFASAGIRVNAVCPGPIRTGMTRRIEDADPARFEALRRAVPLQRWGARPKLPTWSRFCSALWHPSSPASRCPSTAESPPGAGRCCHPGGIRAMPSEPGRLRAGPADIVDIHQLMALYTHLLDNREFGRLGEVFADDAEADYSSGGVTRRLTGLDDIVTFLSDANASSAHHISNVFVYEQDGAVCARTKFFVPYTRSQHDPHRWYGGDYEDVLIRTSRRLANPPADRVRPLAVQRRSAGHTAASSDVLSRPYR